MAIEPLHRNLRRPTRGRGRFQARGLLIIALTLGCCTNIPSATANGSTSLEYQIKLAYLYNFCRYIKWPDEQFENADSTIVLGVLSPDPFGSALDAIADRDAMQGRKIIVRHFAKSAEIRGCHLLFIPRGVDQAVQRSVVQQFSNVPMVVVTELKDLEESNADINLFLDTANTIGFELNADSIPRKRLELSTRLVRLAVIVRTGN